MCWCCKGGSRYENDSGRSLLRQYHTQRTEDGAWLEVKPAGDRVASYEKQLTEQLEEAEQETLTKLIRSQHEINSITATKNFILGFRLGVRIMAECMNDNDGDIRTGGE